MYSQLCDQCMTCAHEILMKFDFKTELKTSLETIQHLKKMLDLVNYDKSHLNMDYELQLLNYSFLDSRCNHCINLNCKTSRESIRIYLKLYVVIKIFECVINSNFKGKLLSDTNFLEVIRNKLITFHIDSN